jgi:hypothetical protein
VDTIIIAINVTIIITIIITIITCWVIHAAAPGMAQSPPVAAAFSARRLSAVPPIVRFVVEMSKNRGNCETFSIQTGLISKNTCRHDSTPICRVSHERTTTRTATMMMIMTATINH